MIDRKTCETIGEQALYNQRGLDIFEAKKRQAAFLKGELQLTDEEKLDIAEKLLDKELLKIGPEFLYAWDFYLPKIIGCDADLANRLAERYRRAGWDGHIELHHCKVAPWVNIIK